METLNGIEEWRQWCERTRRAGQTVGLVPTMGALHEGHASLVRAARARGDEVLMTIFVNPRQFDDARDLAAYPSTPDDDERTAEAAGVSVLVRPTVEEMWPAFPHPTLTSVSVAGLSASFEGHDRPGHFDGVASVVSKLLIVTGPCSLYMGEKDFQQVAVVRQFIDDLGFAVQLHACPTIRDEDGLALSSRNRRLSSEGRRRAVSVSRALAHLAEGTWRASEARRFLSESLREAGLDVAYAEVVHPNSLVPVSAGDSGVGRALVAVRVEGVRLIDNGPVRLEGEN